MFKEILLLAVAAFGLTQAITSDLRTGDMDLIHKQKKIYELFMYVEQSKLIGSECYEIGRTFDLESNMEMFHDKMIVKEFMYRFRLGMLRRDALFSVFYEEHREELVVLFKMLYTAKDFMTFYKTACWCRLYMNKGMFITALHTAVLFRPDCKGIMLPPMYEVYPDLFFDNTVLNEARRIKMMTGTKPTMGMESMDYHVIDHTNMTQMMTMCNMNEDCELAYFTHDVRLNNYYYNIRTLFPFWLPMKDMIMPEHMMRGQFYYYIHQQLLARYNMERMSVGLKEMEDLNINKMIVPGFYSNLVYSNGVAVPNRHFWTNVPMYKYKYVKEIMNIEQRIFDAIDSGMIMDKNGKYINIYTHGGLEMLGDLIEGNTNSCNTRYYGAIEILYRNLLGANYDCKHKNCMIPSVLQTYTAALRDPMFYRMCKIITGFFLRYKCNLPAYTRSELDFAGVIVEDVKVEKMMTYMDKCEYSINNALTVDSMKEGMKWNLKAKKMCLMSKPFTYKMLVKSDKNTKSMVRIFLGPAMNMCKNNDYMCLYKYWYDFVMLDKFTVELTPGMNTITRLSTDCMHCSKNLHTGASMMTKLNKALEGTEPFTMKDKYTGFPTNLYLPRGRVGGMAFKLFVVLTPIDESHFHVIDMPMFGKLVMDGKPLGFPLDRPMMPWFMDLKNMYMKDVNIYHVNDNAEMMMMMRGMDQKMMTHDVKGFMEPMGIKRGVVEDKWMLHDYMTKNKYIA
ncbi:arylphorin subunit alpha [Fopius arisanus]|uniref:Arylphorin subunit alpha n=2 Tax=Fopius arisanus TaxID=64838 RepID=A0A9R1TG33_9HYME|nr:PREDICTED: arylphorin subunit alpha-like [Fopius arisanus]